MAYYKMALIFIAIQAVAVMSKFRPASTETSDVSSSDDSKSRPVKYHGRTVQRRTARQWQYEGIPIEYRARRNKPVLKRAEHLSSATRTKHTPTTTTSTSTSTTPAPIYPPLDRRYRRIYNADETASIEEHPFIAAILVNKQLWCGGAVISADSVLTAAHCLQLQYNNRFFREYVKMLSVRVGSSNATAGGELFRVTELFFHPNYKPQTLDFNFAVLKLHKNITFSKDANIQSIAFSRNKVIPIDKTITFLGWGSVLGVGENGGKVLLQKLNLPVYDLADCQEIYGRDLVTKSNFCAGYISTKKNVCNHDAGGPAIMDGTLTGILSFSSKRCDDTDKPAVFSNTGAAAEWLDSIWNIRSTKEADKLPGWLNGVE